MTSTKTHAILVIVFTAFAAASGAAATAFPQYSGILLPLAGVFTVLAGGTTQNARMTPAPSQENK